MSVYWWLAATAWTAAVSFAAAFIIKNRAIAVLASVCASILIPLALGVLITSLIPIASLGPEEFLQKYRDILVGDGAVHLPQTLLCMAVGITAGSASACLVARSRTRS